MAKKRIYLTYVIESDDIDAIKNQLEDLFGIKMSGWHNDNYGDYYSYRNTVDALKLCRNYQGFDEIDQEHYWWEPDYKEFGATLEVINTSKPEEVKTILSEDKGFKLINHTEFDD